MTDLSTPTNDGQSTESLITQHIDIWTTAIEQKSSAGRGTSNKFSLYGIKKLRELILELAVRGKLVPQDVNDEPASVLLERIAAEKAQLVKEGKLKKQKPLPEIGDDEKPFELALGWEWTRFDNLPLSYSVGLDRGKNLQGPDKKYHYFKMNNISNDGGVNLSGLVSVDASDLEVEQYKLNDNDFLFNTRNSKELVGKTCVYTETHAEPMLYNNNILRATFTEKHLSFILDIWMRCPSGKAELEKIKSGTTNVWAIYQGKLALLLCAIPPLEEQHRIVAKVDELMSLCDALEAQTEASISAHQTLVETLLNALLLPNTTQSADSQSASPESSFADSLEPALIESFVDSWDRVAEHFDTLFTTAASIDTLKQTILQLAVMGKLVEQDPNDEPAAKLLDRIAAEKAMLIKDGKIKKQKPLPAITDEEKPFALPNGWEWVCWGDLLAYDDAAFKRGPFGSSLTKSMFINKGYKVYEQYCPINDDCSFERYYISDEKFEELKGFAVKSGDFLVSCTGATLGRITQIPREFKEGVINQALLRVRINNDVFDAEFFKLLFRSPFFQRSIFANSKGSAIPNLKGVNDLKAMTIPFCSIYEQHRIVVKVSELMTLCDQLKTRLSDAKTTQLHLTDAIVEQAI
ncbi:restriction endonuclease subunit S [Shewanella frigidimarina]|uniref:restriction endonuclease subunit S n=1 Tax=Shewanella frigidimarina TaxID=56812 RepID=UPI003D7A6838